VLNAFLSQRQAMRSPGFLGGRVLNDAHRTFWTLTTWEDEKAMKAFRGSSAHGKVMPRLAHWCDEASYANWEAARLDVPSWEEAYERLVAGARLSRINHPSPEHEARLFPRPRLKPLIGQDLKPRFPS
jgi:heme-degrading monooxygenase HmoA